MNSYLDASFLVSLYSADSNSMTAAHTMARSSGSRFVTSLAELEMMNAFQLRVFRKEITALQAELSLRNFAADLRNGVFLQRPLPESSFIRANRVSQQTAAGIGTRT